MHVQVSCLDHVYLSLELLTTYRACYAHPTYHSDHYFVTLQLQKSSDEYKKKLRLAEYGYWELFII
jgi:hypothetical protein